IERLDQRLREPDLPVREEAPKLRLGRPCPMRGLLLVGAERTQPPVRGEDILHGRGTEGADELVLEIPLADVEAEPFQLGTAEVASEAGALESAPKRPFLSLVAEARQPDIGSARAVAIEEPADRLRAPDRHDRDTLGCEVPALTSAEGLQRHLVA